VKAVREALVKACRIATEEYGKIKGRKSMMPERVALMEFLGRKMLRYVLSFPMEPLASTASRKSSVCLNQCSIKLSSKRAKENPELDIDSGPATSATHADPVSTSD
jgi:hypothetical protein